MSWQMFSTSSESSSKSLSCKANNESRKHETFLRKFHAQLNPEAMVQMIASRISDKQCKWTVDRVHPESSLAGSIGMKQTCKSYAAGDDGCEDSYLDLEKSEKHNKTT
jgi:hypothetical protein